MPIRYAPIRAALALVLTCGFAGSLQAQSGGGAPRALPPITSIDGTNPPGGSTSTAIDRKTVPAAGNRGQAGRRNSPQFDKAERPGLPSPTGQYDPSSPLPGLGDPGNAGGRNLTATGRVMPPTGGRSPALIKASTQADMLKAQKQAEERNKAWDAKMKKTMGSICSGC